MQEPDDDAPAAIFLTPALLHVRATGPAEMRDGLLKVPCVRVATGGWHGWLVVARLTPITTTAIGIKAQRTVH